MAFKYDEYTAQRELLVKDAIKEHKLFVLDNEDFEYTGLCVDCEARKTCALPKPEGGIWHCEEYK